MKYSVFDLFAVTPTMPSNKFHSDFDKFLANKGILLTDAQYNEVHTFMDKGVPIFGKIHREEDPFHREDGLRSWLNSKYNIIGQNRATDWLRSGIGHICLDEVESYLSKDYSWEQVFERAFKLMVNRRWHTKKFIPG